MAGSIREKGTQSKCRENTREVRLCIRIYSMYPVSDKKKDRLKQVETFQYIMLNEE